jgi:hypothetical protein
MSYFSSLKMEVTDSLEMLVDFHQTTQHYILENKILLKEGMFLKVLWNPHS